MSEPTVADVLARLDVVALEIRALRAEMVAGFAELRVDVAGLRHDVADLERSMRELWTEHLGHSHGPEAAA